jgi:hypothetical protein
VYDIFAGTHFFIVGQIIASHYHNGIGTKGGFLV